MERSVADIDVTGGSLCSNCVGDLSVIMAYYVYIEHATAPLYRTSKGRPVRQGQPGGNGYLHIHSFTAIPNRVLTPPVRHEGNCRQEELKYRRLRFRSEVARVSIRFTDQ